MRILPRDLVWAAAWRVDVSSSKLQTIGMAEQHNMPRVSIYFPSQAGAVFNSRLRPTRNIKSICSQAEARVPPGEIYLDS